MKNEEKKAVTTRNMTHIYSGCWESSFSLLRSSKRKELWVYTKISYNVSRKNSRKKRNRLLAALRSYLFIISSNESMSLAFLYTHENLHFTRARSCEHLSRDEMRANTTHWLDDVERKTFWWRKFCDIENFRVFSLATESGEWERERRENREKLKKFHIIICVARF